MLLNPLEGRGEAEPGVEVPCGPDGESHQRGQTPPKMTPPSSNNATGDRGALERSRRLSKALDVFGLVAFQPAVVGLAADAVVTAGRCDVAADLLDVPQHGELMFRPTIELRSAEAEMGDVMESSSQMEDPTVNNLRQF